MGFVRAFHNNAGKGFFRGIGHKQGLFQLKGAESFLQRFKAVKYVADN